MMKKHEKYRNCHVAKKRTASKLLKILIAQIAQAEDLNEDCVNISGHYHLYFPRNTPSKSVTVGLIHSYIQGVKKNGRETKPL